MAASVKALRIVHFVTRPDALTWVRDVLLAIARFALLPPPGIGSCLFSFHASRLISSFGKGGGNKSFENFLCCSFTIFVTCHNLAQQNLATAPQFVREPAGASSLSHHMSCVDRHTCFCVSAECITQLRGNHLKQNSNPAQGCTLFTQC